MVHRRIEDVERRGREMDSSLPCKLCRDTAVGAGDGCCADCMITLILNPEFIKMLNKRRKRQE